MTIKSKEMYVSENVIDLTGPAGNAFSLLGTAQSYAKQLDMNPEPILKEMKESDYENLVAVFEKYFGDYVTLLR